MPTLHFAPGAASFCVHWALRELGVAFELRRVDLAAGEQRSPAYLALNPAGVVPTLVMDDGEVLVESGAILIALAERHPDGALLPPPGTPERARAIEWLLQMINVLQPAFRIWYYPHEAAGPDAGGGAKAEAEARIGRYFDRVDAHLAATGPFLLGERLTVADLMLVMLCRWSRNLPKPATEWPALNGFIGRMRARPAFSAVCDAEGLTEWRG